MKTPLLLFTLCFFNFGNTPLDKLIGTWQLEKIEVGKVVYKPLKINYYLAISKTGVGYNIGVNGISTEIKSITDTSIILSSHGKGSPTLMYEYDDPIVDYIDYSGNYTLNDSLLIIDNGMGKEYLKRL